MPTTRVSVWVRSSGNAADVLEASTYLAFSIGATTPAATTAVTLSANRVAPQAPFTAITWTATPAGGVAPHQYKWRVFDGATWTVAANWSPTNSFIWTPSTANANYRVEVWLRSAGSTADAPEASTVAAFPIEAAAGGANGAVASVSLTSSDPTPQMIGNAILFTATPTGGTAPFLYKWFLFTGTTWTPVADWTPGANYAWYPTEPNANYRIRVWVKGAANTADKAEASAELPFAVTAWASEPPTSQPPAPQPPTSQPPAPQPPAPPSPAAGGANRRRRERLAHIQPPDTANDRQRHFVYSHADRRHCALPLQVVPLHGHHLDAGCGLDARRELRVVPH